MTCPRPHLRLTLMLGALLASLGPGACMKPNPLVHTLAEGEEGETGETGEDEDGSAGETDPSAQGDGSPLPDLGGSSCAPIEDFGEACGACVADSCCDLSSACEGDADCLCLASCELAGAGMGSCQQACGINPKQVPLFEALAACADDSCAGSC